MPGLTKELFSNIWSIFSEALVTVMIVFAFLIYNNVINISEKTMFLLAAVGYGLIVAFGLQGRHKKNKDEMETEKTLVLKNSQIFLVEIFSLFAAIGVLSIVYWSEQELTIVNIIQSLFIFFIVKIVNWYYLKQQI